ncbi:hypothetical protein ACIHCV_45065 [Streptomyces sp. NPDC051956]|uniref:hypothetical protein n=1 Tax=Streptomyces sp. NPDC051956 TaxID=3365677 RepID=UPI0037D56C48
MEKYVWIAVLGIEIVYIGATLAGELLALLLWRAVTRFERALHELPDERYYGAYMTPTITFIVGLMGGVSTSLIGEGLESTVVGVGLTGLLIFALCQHQFREATGHRPRPVARARWRQEIADMNRTLSANGLTTASERMVFRGRAATLAAIGVRMVEIDIAQTWRDGFRWESLRKRTCVVASILLPAVLAVWPAIAHGVTVRAVVGYVALLAVLAGAVGAVAIRRVRLRREWRGLGRELVEGSRQVLDQIACAPSTARPRARPLNIRPGSAMSRTVRPRAQVPSRGGAHGEFRLRQRSVASSGEDGIVRTSPLA